MATMSKQVAAAYNRVNHWGMLLAGRLGGTMQSEEPRRVTLECGHKQEVHSVRVNGPLFVLRCQTCNPGKARRPRKDLEQL